MIWSSASPQLDDIPSSTLNKNKIAAAWRKWPRLLPSSNRAGAGSLRWSAGPRRPMHCSFWVFAWFECNSISLTSFSYYHCTAFQVISIAPVGDQFLIGRLEAIWLC